MLVKAKQYIVGGIIIGISCCWLPALALALGGGSTIMALSNGVGKFSGVLMAIGGVCILYGVYQFNKVGKTQEIIVESKIICPICDFSKMEIMPSDACQYFYECENCHTILKPKEGDCCVYCSYGSVVCPPIQKGECKC